MQGEGEQSRFQEVKSEGIGSRVWDLRREARLPHRCFPREHWASRSSESRQDHHGAQVCGRVLEGKGRSMEKILSWGPRRAKGQGARRQLQPVREDKAQEWVGGGPRGYQGSREDGSQGGPRVRRSRSPRPPARALLAKQGEPLGPLPWARRDGEGAEWGRGENQCGPERRETKA